jgi:hypothetical protein
LAVWNAPKPAFRGGEWSSHAPGRGAIGADLLAFRPATRHAFFYRFRKPGRQSGYRAGAPDGFGYSWFCDLYRGWAGRLKPTMRQTHVAGEKLFVDFAGGTGEVVDGPTGEIIPVQIFVAVLGASNFTYALPRCVRVCGWCSKLIPERPPRAVR